ncbi:C-terminal binding protein AN-like [Canna indica]|uniref:C-terminal binding protein AN-like n=1 Tax=Canna indica TaxID=4628 RepID=A0AAQ3KI63_9LILI|nr:C-terminal binding protein AN-like [Canna indica]
MEAWVREMPNVLILPHSADYSEEVWMEIREKASTILQSFFLDGIVPDFAVSDEDELISESPYEDEQGKKHVKNLSRFGQQIDERHLNSGYSNTKGSNQLKKSQISVISQTIGSRIEGEHSRSVKKGKKRLAHRRSHQKSDDYSAAKSGSSYTSGQDDDTAMSGRDKVLSFSSRFASPKDPRNKQMCTFEPTLDLLAKQAAVNAELNRNLSELLKDGFIIALRSRDCLGYHVTRQRIPGGGWFLDTLSDVSKRILVHNSLFPLEARTSLVYGL